MSHSMCLSSIESLDVFVRNYFNRMFIVQDVMNKTKMIIDKAHEDPQAILTIRSRMALISRDIIQMEEILGYMNESLSIMEVPPEPAEQAGRALYERLQLAKLRGQLERRVTDLVKNMQGSRNQMEFLLGLTNVVSEQKMFQVQYNQQTAMQKVSRQVATNRRTYHRARTVTCVGCWWNGILFLGPYYWRMDCRRFHWILCFGYWGCFEQRLLCMAYHQFIHVACFWFSCKLFV